ncbi:RNA-binding S4 domain-containing protein [Corynebacterium sp. HMSC27B11]
MGNMQQDFPVVPIRDTEIRLGQFLKLANLVETGGMAKDVLAEGAVSVNGAAETRRGKALRDGDQVTITDPETGTTLGAEVGANGRSVADSENLAEEDDLGEFFDEATADDDFDPEKWRNL